MTYRTKRAISGILFTTPYAVVFIFFIVLPIVVAAVLAFMQFDLTNKGSIHFIGWNNFKELWADTYFWQAMGASTRYAVMMVPSLLITAFAMALGMNTMSRGKEMVRAWVFVPGMFTVAVTAILWQYFYDLEFGLFNFLLKAIHVAPIPWTSEKGLAMPSIVAMSLWWTAGGTSVILLVALQQIPRQYIEAASLDGAGPRKLFGHIVLPLLKPALLFVTVTNTIAAFQMFPQAYLLTQGGPENSTRGMVQYIYETAFNNYRLGYAASMSWMLTIVILFFALIQYWLLRRSAV